MKGQLWPGTRRGGGQHISRRIKTILSNGLLPGTSSSDTRNFWRESFRLLGKLFGFLLGVVIVYSERVRGEPLVTIYIGCTVDMTLNHPLERGTVVEI